MSLHMHSFPLRLRLFSFLQQRRSDSLTFPCSREQTQAFMSCWVKDFLGVPPPCRTRRLVWLTTHINPHHCAARSLDALFTLLNEEYFKRLASLATDVKAFNRLVWFYAPRKLFWAVIPQWRDEWSTRNKSRVSNPFDNTLLHIEEQTRGLMLAVQQREQ